MQDLELEADSFATHLSSDGEQIRITFHSGQDEIAAILARSRIPQLAASLLAKAGPGNLRPIGSNGLPVGTTFRVRAQELQALPEGGARLTLHLEVADGVRTLPMDLSRDEALRLIADLAAILHG